MDNATLLVVLGKSAKPLDLEPLSDTARERGLHLAVLILGAMPAIPTYSYGIGEFGAYALPKDWQAEVDTANADLTTLRSEIAAYLADQGTSADVRVFSGEVAVLPDAMARAALTCDLIVLGDDLRDNDFLFRELVGAALFRAPAGLVLNASKSPAALRPRSVFVAWKAGIPASRAVRAATGLLRAATEVTVALFDPKMTGTSDGENPGSDVAAWLNRLGCSVTVQQYPSGGKEIGTAILDRAGEAAADLIVLGAYDHSRLRETVFGGTTRTLIEQRDRAVMLCH